MFLTILEFFKRFSSKPWGVLKTSGLDSNGGMFFEIYFNTAFVNNVRSAGFTGNTDKEAVENFFLFTKTIAYLPEKDKMMEEAYMEELRKSVQ